MIIEKHTSESHKSAIFGARVVRETLVFQRPRISARVKKRSILQLSSMLAPSDPVGKPKSFNGNALIIGAPRQHEVQNSTTDVMYVPIGRTAVAVRGMLVASYPNMPRAIPHYLYKYRPVDANALAMLASDKVYMSRLDAFNDPFEALNLDPTLEPKLAEQQHGTFAVSKQPVQAEAVGNSLRACSLSEECQDLLMWGHYADRHRGFCIRFDFRNDPELSKLLYRIDYEPALPQLDKKVEQSLEKALSSTLTKSEKWSYEREWRIVGRVPDEESNAGELFATYRPEAITGIIFGVRTPELHKQLIRKVLQDRRVEYLQAEKQAQNFALLIRPLKEK